MEPAAVRADLPAVAAAFLVDSGAVVGRIRSARDLAAPVPGLAWTLGEVVAHLVVVYHAFAMSLGQSITEDVASLVATVGTLPERLAATNANALKVVSFSSVGEAAEALSEAAAELHAAIVAVRDPDEPRAAPWYGMEPRAAVLAVMAEAETLGHGRDIARALGLPDSMSDSSAALVAPTMMTEMLPLLVNPETTRGMRLTYEFRLRGGPRFRLVLDDTRAWATSAAEGGDVDCVTSVTASAAILIGYGRLSTRRALLTGQAFSFGRAPWLGLRFPTYFLRP